MHFDRLFSFQSWDGSLLVSSDDGTAEKTCDHRVEEVSGVGIYDES